MYKTIYEYDEYGNLTLGIFNKEGGNTSNIIECEYITPQKAIYKPQK